MTHAWRFGDTCVLAYSACFFLLLVGGFPFRNGQCKVKLPRWSRPPCK